MKRITFTVCREEEAGPRPLTGGLSYVDAQASHDRHRAPGQRLPIDRTGRRLSIVRRVVPAQVDLFGGG